METLTLATDLGAFGPVAVATAASIILGLYLRGSVRATDADRLWKELRAELVAEREEKREMIARHEAEQAAKNARIVELEHEKEALQMENWTLKMNQRKGR